MQPSSTSFSKRGIWIAVLLNVGVFWLLFQLAQNLTTPEMGTHPNDDQVSYGLFFLELGQGVLNVGLAVVFALLRWWGWLIGCGVAALLALLTAVGALVYTFTHLA